MNDRVRDQLMAGLFLFAMMCFGAAAIITVVMGSWSLREYTCKVRWEGHDPRWSWSGGCQIKVDGKYIPESAYAVRRWE